MSILGGVGLDGSVGLTSTLGGTGADGALNDIFIVGACNAVGADGVLIFSGVILPIQLLEC